MFITFQIVSSQLSFWKLVCNLLRLDSNLIITSHESRDVTRQLADGYVFFDWFAIPQITARAKGTNEDLTRSDAAKAVQSSPFYVEARLEVWRVWRCLKSLENTMQICKINRIVTFTTEGGMCPMVHFELLRCLSVGAGVHDSNGILMMIIFRIAILPLFSSESMSQEIESGFRISQLTPQL